MAESGLLISIRRVEIVAVKLIRLKPSHCNIRYHPRWRVGGRIVLLYHTLLKKARVLFGFAGVIIGVYDKA